MMSDSDERSLRSCRGMSSERSVSYESCESGVEILARKVNDYRSAHTQLVKDHHMMKTENDSLWERVHTLQDENKKLGLTHLNLREECVVMTDACVELYNGSSGETRRIVSVLHEHVKKYSDILASSTAAPCIISPTRHSQLEAKLIASRSHCEDLELAKQQLSTTVHNLTMELKEMDVLREANRKLTHDYSALLTERSNAVSESRDMISREGEHEKRLADLKEQVGVLNEGNVALMKQLTNLEREKDAVINDLTRQVSSLSVVMADMAHGTAEADKLREENLSLKRQANMELSVSSTPSASASVMSLQTEVARLASECSKYEGVVSKLNMEIRRMESEKARYGVLLEPLEKELTRQQQAAGELAGENLRFHEESARLKQENAKLKKREHALAEEVCMLKNTCNIQQLEAAALQQDTSAEAQELHQQLDSLRTELEHVKTSFEKEKNSSTVAEDLLLELQATRNDVSAADRLAEERRYRLGAEEELRRALLTIRQMEARLQEPADPEILQTLAELKAQHSMRTAEVEAMKQELCKQLQLEDELQDLKQRTSHDTSSYTLELEVLKSKLADAKSTISKLEVTLEQVTKSYQTEKEENLKVITTGKLESSKLANELSETKAEICKLEDERTRLNRLEREAHTELCEAKQERAKFKKMASDLEEELASLKKMHADTLRVESSHLAAELHVAKSKTTEAQGTVVRLEAALEQVTRTSQTEKENSLACRLENTTLQNELDALKKANRDLESDTASRKVELAEMEMNVVSLQAQLKKTAREHEELRREMEAIRVQYVKSSSLVEDMKQTEKRLLSESQMSDTSLDTYKREIARLHIMLEERDMMLQSHQSRYEQFEDSTACLQREIEHLQGTDASNAVLQQKLETACSRHAELDNTCEDLVTELQTTRSVLQKTQADRQAEAAKVVELEMQLKNLENDKAGLVLELAKLAPKSEKEANMTSVENMIDALRRELHEGKQEEAAHAKQEAARLTQELQHNRASQVSRITGLLENLHPGAPLPRSPNSGFKELSNKTQSLKEMLYKAEMEIAGLKKVVNIHQETEERLRAGAADWTIGRDSSAFNRDIMALKERSDEESAVLRKVIDSILTIAFTIEGDKGHELREMALVLPKCVQTFDYLSSQVKIGLKAIAAFGTARRENSENEDVLAACLKLQKQHTVAAQQELDSCFTEWEVERTLYQEEVLALKEQRASVRHRECVVEEDRQRTTVLLEEALEFSEISKESKADMLETVMVMQSEVNCATRQWNAIKDELWAFVTSNVVTEEQSSRSALQQRYEHGLLELTIWLLSVSQEQVQVSHQSPPEISFNQPKRSPAACWTSIRPSTSTDTSSAPYAIRVPDAIRLPDAPPDQFAQLHANPRTASLPSFTKLPLIPP